MLRTSRTRALGAVCASAALLSFAGAGLASAAPKSVPSLAAPRAGVAVDAIPAFSWRQVKNSAKYEFQLSADPQFESIVGRGAFQTRNTFATIDDALPNGDYYWRVRSISELENASRWSRYRKLRKNWNEPPQLIEPIQGEAIPYPQTPLVLRWQAVPRAYKYLVWIGTDPSLASVDKPIETSATVLALPQALGSGRYYWAVTPLDAERHRGTRSGVGSFTWTWPSKTTPEVFDLNADARVFDPQFSWGAVPGASRYEVEINTSQDFAVGSKVCCTERVIGTSLSPKKILPNNTYYWRMRAVDLDGQAGQWNHGTPFRKGFDEVEPSIPNLHMRDNEVDAPADPDTSTIELETAYPIVDWDPVPGAASYEVEVAPFESATGQPGDPSRCNWTAQASRQWNVKTATTAWTPLAKRWNGQKPSVSTDRTVSSDSGRALVADQSYCARVRARSDRDWKSDEVVSAWTQLSGPERPAFKWKPAPALAGPISYTSPGHYVQPQTGAIAESMPLFTWKPVAGAGSYFVVVAKDPAFTQILDMALTNLPMYAPRRSAGPETYPDETTSYYWAVVPASGSEGEFAASEPIHNSPQEFKKRSVPPTLLSPNPQTREDVTRQPVFRWTSTEGARNYTIQVATDPSFSNPLDDVTTAATSYTSESTYPADTVLYWRVRANDENLVGLTWSQVGTFRRLLPAPRVFADNPLGGETIPVLRWQPVEGATSYDMHVEQADGTRKDFHLRGTAFTATIFYGTGIWHWQVRANFAGEGPREVQGGYTPLQAFTRHIATPTKLRAVNKNRHLLLKWKPTRMARSYRVEVSTTDSFTTLVDRASTDHVEWAPKLVESAYIAGGRLFWRVATVDEGGNIGGWRVAKLRLKRGFVISASGSVRKKSKDTVRIIVRDGRNRGIRKAKIVVTGAGTPRRVVRTDRQGLAYVNVRPRRRGLLKFNVTKRGYVPGRATLQVY